ncbi:MAG: LysM peptidoglycan-binding domain-containing protein [Spirochaetes bacterium]|nr:LysM peptidoglycan-binding domain-containing protein [Spirochaetota bacterium]
MRLTRSLCLLALLWIPLGASSSLLLYEMSPSVIGGGRSYDLLAGSANWGRTYSGAFSLRNKTEASFYNATLPMNLSLQYLQVGLGRSVLPGLRLGAYLTYFNAGGFSKIDERGGAVALLDASDFLVGIPLVFDPDSLPWRRKDGSPSRAEAFLKQWRMGVNLNYYKSQFDKLSGDSFLVDANLSARFPVGYLGQPRPLLSLADLDREYGQRKKETEASLLAGVPKGKSPSKEAMRKRELILRYWEDYYDHRKEDLAIVNQTRGEIFRIYNDPSKDLTPLDVTNLVRQARQELDALHKETVDETRDNERSMRDALEQDLRQVEEALVLVNARLEKASPALASEARNLQARYDLWIQTEIWVPSPESLKARHAVETIQYKVLQRESWAELSKRLYKDPELGESLRRANGSPTNQTAAVGQLLTVPPRRYYKDLEERDKILARRAEELAGFAEYQVRPDDTWAKIAEAKLGSRKAVSDLLVANKRDAKQPLLPGQVIKIPLANAGAARQQREREFQAGLAQRRAIGAKLLKNELAEIDWAGLNGLLEQKLAIFQFQRAWGLERDASLRDLQNLLNAKRAELDRGQNAALAGLDRIQLKRRLDFLNSANEKVRRDALGDYKRKEQVVFENLLLSVWRSKTALIGQLKKEAVAKRKGTLKTAEWMDRVREAIWRQGFELRVREAGKDKARLAALEKEAKAHAEQARKAGSASVAAVEREHAQVLTELGWRDYVTEMIYRGSTRKRDTLALGASVRNLGTGMTWGGPTAEALPMAVSADLNYEFLHTKNHGLVLYGHYGYSEIEDHHAAFGAAYRFLGAFEVRSGMILESGIPVLSASLGANIELGLMSYRLDAATQLRIFGAGAKYGNQFTFGLAITF